MVYTYAACIIIIKYPCLLPTERQQISRMLVARIAGVLKKYIMNKTADGGGRGEDVVEKKEEKKTGEKKKKNLMKTEEIKTPRGAENGEKSINKNHSGKREFN